MSAFIPPSQMYGMINAVYANNGKNTVKRSAESADTAEQAAAAKEKSALEKLEEKRNAEYQQVLQQMKDMKEAEKENKDKSKSLDDYGKMLRIASRIMNGDKVPIKDQRKLAEEYPDLYRQAMMMRRTDNLKPKKYKSEFEDEEDDSTDSERMVSALAGETQNSAADFAAAAGSDGE